ncbi:hypothetical protein KVR01_008293 [Diaporthe batatas]|uniref:uncharacterized protein n=1 Tax=Diaporthe batatas TaxID=748121 RepID=UPI001D03B74F|nr:uncharacterized protein KVR01_008293 [Diaporthe batatas]KAG8162528.1 hypothetical protein KVR01_008293 [Diaporthe batatas]
MEARSMHRAGPPVSADELGDDPNRPPKHGHDALPRILHFLFLWAVVYWIVVWLRWFGESFNKPRVVGTAPEPPEREGPGDNASDEEDLPGLRSRNSPADSNPSEETILPTSPVESNSPPTTTIPLEHSGADSGLPEQDITKGLASEDGGARLRSLLETLAKFEEHLNELNALLKSVSMQDEWLEICGMVLLLQDSERMKLKEYNPFEDRAAGQVNPMLKTLQGPVEHIPGAPEANADTVITLSEIIKLDTGVVKLMESWIVRRAVISKAVLMGNAAALEAMRDVASDSDPLALGRFDGLMKRIEENNKLVMKHDSSIAAVSTLLASVIAEHRAALDVWVMTATADILIALVNVPSGWETLQANSGHVVRNQAPPGDTLRSGTAPVPADIVDNSSQADDRPRTAQLDPQLSEDMKKLRAARQDLEKLRVRTLRLMWDHQPDRMGQEAAARDQESQATEIFASKAKACLKGDMLQLGGSMRERWQRYVRGMNGRDAKQVEAATPATATTNPTTTSADGEDTTTTIIG